MIPYVNKGSLVSADQQNTMIDQINTNTTEIELLKTTGGGGPEDPFINWYAGDGPPPVTIIGSARGDMYVDRTAGELYQLM